jgi:uncharacterized protein YjbJ (UPF0337 family)
MAGSGDELKGSLKQGLGKLTGDEALEAEGAAQKTGGRAARKASGAVNEGKGSLKGKAGDVLDSPSLKAKGLVDKAKGKLQGS